MLDPQICIKDGKEIKPTLPYSSVAKLLINHSKNLGEKTAITFADIDSATVQNFSYAELLKNVQSLTHLLLDKYSLRKGDAIALHLGNDPLLLFCHLAAFANGLINVPLDLKRDSSDRKLYKINTTQAKLIITSKKSEDANLAHKIPQTPVVYTEEIYSHSTITDLALNDMTDPALILFTSGTTAQPKGVVLTAQNIFLNANGIIDWLKITAEDKFHIVLPLHHINSTTMSIATLIQGGTIVLSSRYSKSRFFKTMADHNCTLSSIVPTICLDLLSEKDQFSTHKNALTQIKRIQLGSAPVVQKDVSEFHRLYSIPLVEGYGSTETALRVSGVRPWGLDNPTFLKLSETNSIGSEQKWNNLTIMLPSGQEAAENEIGEICVRGPILTKGYLNDQEATDKAFFDGWFHTGDVGYWKKLDGVKQYYINGRSKEIIIKGGTNISPLTIEEAILKQFPFVKTCFVVGAPDKRYGEELAAVIVFHDSANKEQKEIVAKTLSDKSLNKIRDLSEYDTPKYCFVTTESSLPKTSTGKVQRVIIRSYIQAIFSPIAKTDQHIFRQLTPFDQEFLEDLTQIHNTRWGDDLKIDQETLKTALSEGIVIGAIDNKTNQPQGILFALRTKGEEIISLTDKFRTYDTASGQLTLSTHEPTGDSLLLVSVATQGEAFPKINIDNLNDLKNKAPEIIKDYLPSDPVIKFHLRPKAGLRNGASILHIIPDGRVKDTASLGYSVILQYPRLDSLPRLDQTASLGIQLVEASFIYAFDHQIQNIFAYSRPAGLLNFLMNKYQ